MERKIVVHINTGTTGGPGGILNSVYDALEENGYENHIISPRGESKKRLHIIGKKSFYFSRILSKILEKLSGLKEEAFYPDIFTTNKAAKISKAIGKNIDYVILYWYKNYIDYKTLIELKETNNCRIYIYMMDYAVLTGACHYPGECKNYIDDCKNCKGFLARFLKYNVTSKYLKRMKKALKETETTILTPSYEDFLKINSLDLKKEVLTPPLSSQYDDVVKDRKKFGIDNEDFVIFFGAERLTLKRKGFEYLLSTLKYINLKLNEKEKKKVVLLIAGRGDINDIDRLDFRVKKIGYLDRTTLIEAYKIADLFISPSIMDAGPMMVKEAIRSGTPVVCFKNVGDAGEIVKDAETGFRANYKDYIDMGEKIIKIITMEKKELEKMKKKCLELGKQKLTYKIFNKRINEIFKK